MSTLQDLQDWYFSQCNDDWDHGHRVRIETLDNPGWAFRIDLTDTVLSGREFPVHSYGVGEKAETSGNEWLICEIKYNKFTAHGGPAKLEEMINVFLN
ncbi:rhodanese-related sulfurtransferase [Xanthomonas sp. LMG 8992]|uniref:immunity 53 family protein n=1 Tax=Xanthomonas sp. LMG 8992 TaxID=1591157 RepID=UPI00136B96F9|nr:immunity 53 family protein [Xanthomonas sp. LMG 8992]MXV13340.1 rhodanese-related sulfurtransferase [Xanthomonas sp. LMG 8992]